jgi:hypothetical protein
MKKLFKIFKKGAKPSAEPIENDSRQTTRTAPEDPARAVKPDHDVVATFSGFDTWLASFKPADPIPNELPAEQGPVELPVKESMQHPKGFTDRYIHSKWRSCPESSLFLALTVLFVDGDNHETIMLVLTGVRKHSTKERYNVTIKVPCYITLSTLGDLLIAQGSSQCAWPLRKTNRNINRIPAAVISKGLFWNHRGPRSPKKPR